MHEEENFGFVSIRFEKQVTEVKKPTFEISNRVKKFVLALQGVFFSEFDKKILKGGIFLSIRIRIEK